MSIKNWFKKVLQRLQENQEKKALDFVKNNKYYL